MPAPRRPRKRLSRTVHVLTTLGFLTVGGLVVGCVVLAYVFVSLPSRNVLVPGVAGAIVVPWEKPVLHEDAPIAPSVSAVSGVLVDVASAEVLWAKNAHAVRPLASLTKLATVGAYIARRPNLEDPVTIPATFATDGIADVVEPGTAVSRLRIPAGAIVTQRDLLAAALIGSANNAALTLAKTMGESPAEIIQGYVRSAGAQTARIVEPTGLDPANTGSVLDVLLLAHAAFRTPVVSELASEPAYTINGTYRVVSTNQLNPHGEYNILAAKTGYLVEAGYNFAVQVERDGRTLLLVTLGSTSSANRFTEAHNVLQWAYTNYDWVPQF